MVFVLDKLKTSTAYLNNKGFGLWSTDTWSGHLVSANNNSAPGWKDFDITVIYFFLILWVGDMLETLGTMPFNKTYWPKQSSVYIEQPGLIFHFRPWRRKWLYKYGRCLDIRCD